MRQLLLLVVICACAVLELNAQNVRVRGKGIDIDNVGSSGYKLMYPLGTRTGWESRYYKPGEYHLFDSRPSAIRDKDFATTPKDGGDSRKDYAIESFSVDAPAKVTIAVPSGSVNAAGWTKTSTTFKSSISTFTLYTYDYKTPGTWVTIPSASSSVRTLLFADKGRLKFDNPLPISALAEGVTVTVAYDEYNRGDYTVDPDLLILPNGDYIAGESGRRHVSKDKGKTWAYLNQKSYGLRHASTFYHDGALYIIGDTRGPGGIVRSTDDGKTWSKPVKLIDDFRNSPSHVEISKGRIWIAYENLPRPHTVNFLSASTSSDLMKASSWVSTKRTDNVGTGNETDMVLGRDGWPIAMPKGGGPAVRASSATQATSKGDADGFDLPVSGSKYTAKYDPISDKWWALTSYSPIKGNVRTGIALYSSTDLKTFKFERQVLQGKSTAFHGFNYPSMQIDGGDVVFVLRTAWENEMGQAQRWHDGNMLTFHRVRDFRGSTPNPPTCSLVPYTNVNDGGWNSVATAAAEAGDKVWFGPQSSQFGADEGGWSWTGPKGFTSTKRGLLIENVRADQAGTYKVSNTDANGCTATTVFALEVGSGGGDEPLGAGTYHFKNVATGEYLDADPGGVLLLSKPRDGADVRWNLLLSTPGYFFVENEMADRGPIAAKPSLNSTVSYLDEKFLATAYVNREWRATSVGVDVYKFLCKDEERGYLTADGKQGVINAADGDADVAHWELIRLDLAQRSLDADAALQLSVAPNPVVGASFELALNGMRATEVSVRSATGAEVSHQALDPSQPLSSLTLEAPPVAGLYFVTATDVVGGTRTVKFVVD